MERHSSVGHSDRVLRRDGGHDHGDTMRWWHARPGYLIAALIAILAALIILSGCGPLNRVNPNSPAPVEAVELVFHADTHPSGMRLVFHIDAVDSRGGSGINAETGRPYPWDGSRVTPYEHKLLYEPGLVLHATGSAILGSEEGDLLTCWWTDNGVEVPGSRQVAQVTAGHLAASAKVTCTATTLA